jgi:DNA-binding NtrC family response regulator
MMRLPLAFVWDSESAVRSSTAEAMRLAGLDVIDVATLPDALDLARTRPIAVGVVGMNGSRGATFDVVERLRQIRPTAVFAVLDGDGESGVSEAMRAGAFDVLPRPPQATRVGLFSARALAQHELLEEVAQLRADMTADGEPGDRQAVATLARRFVEGLCRLNGLPPIEISAEALAALEQHDWAGKPEELRHAVETAVILASDGTIQVKDLPAALRAHAGNGNGNGHGNGHIQGDQRFRDAKRTIVDAFEQSYLSDLLRRHGGNVTAAAETSGMLRSALQRLLRKHEIRSSSFRGQTAVEVDVS